MNAALPLALASVLFVFGLLTVAVRCLAAVTS